MTTTTQTWRTSLHLLMMMMRKDLCDTKKFSASRAFFNRVGIMVYSFHRFGGAYFWYIFSLFSLFSRAFFFPLCAHSSCFWQKIRARFFSLFFCNCSLVSFVSRNNNGWQFLLPFEDHHQFAGVCFQTKIKTNAFPPLSLHEQRLAPMNARKGKR